MGENNIVQQTSPTGDPKQGYQTLGKKVFWLFFLQISPVAIILLIISLVFFILSSQASLVNTFLGNMQRNAFFVALIIFILSIHIVGNNEKQQK